MSNIVKLENKTESLIMQGDLSKLSPEERVSYVVALCEKMGLNHLSRPFDYIQFQGRMVLYAKKEATDQLRQIYGVSVTDLKKEIIDGILFVTAYGETKEGKKDVSTGALVIQGLKGVDLANAMMKAETKAKRRLTLSICGLGLLDESEVSEDPRDITPEPKQVAAPQPFDDDARTKKIKEVVSKFMALQVSEDDIKLKFNLESVSELSDEQYKELNRIGAAIKRKEIKKEDAFPVF